MEKAEKAVVADHDLRIEAYRFQGLSQPFSLHFHAHYVLGLVERGIRDLTCKGQKTVLHPGQLFLLNPGDSHACAQCGDEPLDYRSVTIPIETMTDLVKELAGTHILPVFPEPVADDPELACQFRAFHQLLLSGGGRFEKEEALLLLAGQLLEKHGRLSPPPSPECRREIQRACAYMDRHFAERVTLDQVCRHAGLSRSTLLRAMTRDRGITPYRYLEAVRVNAAKRLLEQGTSPLEAALETGFSDQSHFTNHFTAAIGVSPGVYRDICKRGGKGEQHGRSE